jgi:Spy/CpxP family protein refolding chaperone
MIALLGRRLVPGLLVLLLALVPPLLGLPALGQEVQPTPRGERIIEALLIWRLVDELDLTEGQIARIFPRIKMLKTIRIELGRRVPPLLREIRQLNRQIPRDDDAIRIKVAELNRLRAEIEVRRRRQLEAIAAVLTPEQLGKFAFIQETFEVETLRLLQEARRIAEEQSLQRR